MTLRLTASLLGLAAGATLVSPAAAQFTIDGTSNYLVGSQPSGAAVGDFDGDGDLDLATTVDGPDRVAILLNDGTGHYVAGPAAILPNSSSPQDLAAGDFDGDGDVDLAIALRDPAGSVMILSNTGAGTFVAAGTYAVGDRPRGLDVADHDGDKDLDIAVAARDGNTASVLTNIGGTFTVATFAAGSEPRATAFIDVDGDGDRDLAVTSHDDRTVRLFTNSGGAFSAGAVLSVGPFVRPDGIDAADLDGDGDADLAVAVSDDTFNIHQAMIFLNAGGAFGAGVGYASGGQNPGDIAAADLDCDGLMDLAIANQDSASIGLLRNLGGGAFGAATLVSAGISPEHVAAADLDGDGDADVASANRDSNDMSVALNMTCTPPNPDVDGDGVVGFSDLVTVLASWGSCPGCPADVDGNGVVDFSDIVLVLANWTS